MPHSPHTRCFVSTWASLVGKVMVYCFAVLTLNFLNDLFYLLTKYLWALKVMRFGCRIDFSRGIIYLPRPLWKKWNDSSSFSFQEHLYQQVFCLRTFQGTSRSKKPCNCTSPKCRQHSVNNTWGGYLLRRSFFINFRQQQQNKIVSGISLGEEKQFQVEM